MTLPIKDHDGIETVLNLLLVRFGIIAAIVVVLVIALFAVALMLRRSGRLKQASRRIAPYARQAALARRRSRGRDDIFSAGLAVVANSLDGKHDKGQDTR